MPRFSQILNTNKARALTFQNFCLPRMNPRKPHVGEASKMTGRKPTLPMRYLGFRVYGLEFRVEMTYLG
jgi:hypothetical protein